MNSIMLNNFIKFYIPLITSIFCMAANAENQDVKLAYVGPDTHTAYLGSLQGLNEANLQGQFLGKKYSLDLIPPDKALSRNYEGYMAIITAVDYDTFINLVNIVTDIPVFNTNLVQDSLRLDCRSNTFHIIPGNKMLEDAVAQWHKKNPGTEGTARAWHQDFVKFAARDLNKRYLKEHDQPMDDYAWAGWAAVKMTSDAIVRGNITGADQLIDFLKNDLAFDGQKGIDMSFRTTGQLRQPILIIENDKIVAEAPIRGVANPPTVESLGITGCPK